MYADSEDFRDLLADQGIIAEEDMLSPYIEKGSVYEVEIEDDDAYLMDANGDTAYELTADLIKEWKKKGYFTVLSK